MDIADRERLDQLIAEPIAIVPHDPRWAVRYAEEEGLLRSVLPHDLVIRIDHIGSTAVPELTGKPIIDIQVQVRDVVRVEREVMPHLVARGYEFIWRPTIGERAPFYAWFIKRDEQGFRTHHIHMVEPDEATEDRLLFRDYLRRSPEEAAQYEALKRDLHQRFPNNRSEYTLGKTEYILSVVHKARAERV